MILEHMSQWSWMEDDIFAASSDAPIHMNMRSFSDWDWLLAIVMTFSFELPSYPFGCVWIFPCQFCVEGEMILGADCSRKNRRSFCPNLYDNGLWSERWWQVWDLSGDDFVSTVQVFVPKFEHVFVLGGIWGVCVEDFLRDSMLHRLFVDSAWLLHHARTTCGHRSKKHRRPCFLVISHSHRLQSGCAPICSKKYKDLLARKISFQNGNYCNCLLAVFTREKSQCLKDEWMCGFCFAFTEAAHSVGEGHHRRT